MYCLHFFFFIFKRIFVLSAKTKDECKLSAKGDKRVVRLRNVRNLYHKHLQCVTVVSSQSVFAHKVALW